MCVGVGVRTALQRVRSRTDALRSRGLSCLILDQFSLFSLSFPFLSYVPHALDSPCVVTCRELTIFAFLASASCMSVLPPDSS